MQSNLLLNENGIYVADVKNRSAELRARTFLYYANSQNKLHHCIAPLTDDVMVHIYDVDPKAAMQGLTLEEKTWATTPGSGFIYLSSMNGGWKEQRGRLLLIPFEDGYLPMDAYFLTPQRWLADRGFEKVHLEKAFILKGILS